MLYGVGSISVVRVEASAADYMNPICFSEFTLTKSVDRLVHQTLVDDTFKTVGIETDGEQFILTLRSEINNVDSVAFAEDRIPIDAGGTLVQTFYETVVPPAGSVILPGSFVLSGTDGVYDLTLDRYLLEIQDYNFSANPLEVLFDTALEGNTVKIAAQFTNGTLREISDNRIGKITFTGITNGKLDRDEEEQLLIQVDDLRPIGSWNLGINGSGAAVIESQYVVIQGTPSIKFYRIQFP